MGDRVKNIVLVGCNGNGKSATGNSLIGREVFRSEMGASSGTMTCQSFTRDIGGFRINVIDTPGPFDSSDSAKDISKEIINCLNMAKGGLHAVALVFSVKGRITKDEENTLCKLQILFGNEVLNYLIVVFTGGDILEARNQTLDDYFRDGCPEFLLTVLRHCRDRKVLVDNVTRDENKKSRQIQQFLAHVETIGRNNGGKPFRDDMQISISQDADLFREQQQAIESENIGRAQTVEELRNQLQRQYENNMQERVNMMELRLREASDAHERMIKMQQENHDATRRQNQVQMVMQTAGAAVIPLVIGTATACTIL